MLLKSSWIDLTRISKDVSALSNFEFFETYYYQIMTNFLLQSILNKTLHCISLTGIVADRRTYVWSWDFMIWKNQFWAVGCGLWSGLDCEIKGSEQIMSNFWGSFFHYSESYKRGHSQTTFTRVGFLHLHFLWYKSLQKVDLFDHLPPSTCKRSLWTAPNIIFFKNISFILTPKSEKTTFFLGLTIWV